MLRGTVACQTQSLLIWLCALPAAWIQCMFGFGPGYPAYKASLMQVWQGVASNLIPQQHPALAGLALLQRIPSLQALILRWHSGRTAPSATGLVVARQCLSINRYDTIDETKQARGAASMHQSQPASCVLKPEAEKKSSSWRDMVQQCNVQRR